MSPAKSSPMAGGSMPKPSHEAKEAFLALLPPDPQVATRPMFGNMAAFVNGNMFAGLFGEALFVRLPDAEREKALQQGGTNFEPMPGRAMKGYVTLPVKWREDDAATRDWITRSLTWAKDLPAKEPKKRR